MKKKLILVLCLSVALFCTACNNKSGKGNVSVDSGYENIIDVECTSEFNSTDEMAEHIISNKDDIFSLFFNHPTQKADPENLKFFSLGNPPDGYELEKVNQRGEKITLTYKNKTDAKAQPINLIWMFTTEGDVYIKSVVMMNRLTEIPAMKGYYYTTSQDENGEDICQISWCEDGYVFELDGPSGLIDDKNFKIVLDKTEYPLG